MKMTVIVSGYTYDGVVVPQIQYLGSNAVALRDDGFTIYSGRQIPKELKTVQVEQEIISTFFMMKTTLAWYLKMIAKTNSIPCRYILLLAS